MPINKLPTLALESNAITADLIASGAITAADISDGEITAAKLHTTLDFSTKTFTMHNNHVTQAMVTQHQAALSLTQSQISDLSTTNLTEGTNLYYTDSRADARAQIKVDALVDAAPGTLDTLNELAAALGDDPNFATTVTNSIATKLPLSGGTMTGNVTFGDNNKAIFGAGSDLSIFHNGTTSLIEDSGTGGLTLRSNLFTVQNASGTETVAQFLEDGFVKLFHNNAQKLATTATGINVTGTVTAVGGNTNNTDDAAVFKGTGTEHIKLLLDTSSTGGHRASVALESNSNEVNISTTGSDEIRFSTASTSDALFIKSDGNVGIGDSTPTEGKLVVRGDANTNGLFVGGDSTTGQSYGALINAGTNSSDANFRLYDQTGSTPYVIVRGDGNVGIGTASPDKTLTVRGTSGDVVQAKIIYAGSDGNRSGLILQNTHTGGREYGLYVGNNSTGAGLGNSFGISDNTASTAYRLIIDSSGNVGIGTTSPKSTLDTGYTRIYNSGAASSPSAGKGLEVHYVTSGRTQGEGAYLISYDRDNSAYKQFVVDANNIELSTGGNNRLSILSNGNVGIGTTSPGAKLDVRGSIVQYLDNGGISFNKTSSVSSTNKDYYGAILRVDSNGYHYTSTQGGFGSAANDLAFMHHGNLAFATTSATGDNSTNYPTGRMIILENGNVGIGTRSPATKLQVNGNVKVGSAAHSAWASSIHDIGGLDVIVGSGSHALQLWDDNQQSAPRFEVERAGTVTMGTTLHLHESRGGDAYSVSGSSQTYNLMMPSFYGSGSINQTYRHAYNINTPFHTTLWQGGGGNTVFTTWSKIGAEHYKDIYIETYTLYYSDIKIKVITDGNANVSVWYAGNTYNNNVYSARWRVYPLQACTITMNPSSSQSAVYMVHQASGGRQESATDTATAGSGPSTW